MVRADLAGVSGAASGEVEGAAIAGSWPDVSLLDHVTQIGNRRFFEQRLDLACSGQASWSALLLLDLDRFKAVNDTLGHAAGDALLCRVAERMQSLLGPGDVLARLGGDEFAILLGSVAGEPEIAAVGRKLIDLVQRTYLIEGQPVNIGVSIGITLLGTGEERVALLRSADLALYHSKNAGRGCFHFFDPSMEARAQARRTMELDLRKATALRQLELHYKPQIDVGTQRLVGFAAVLRWRHPRQGLLTASQFLPLAQEIGLTDTIGEWVLRAACREAAQWESSVVVSVHVSPQQFEGSRFVGVVERALSLAGIAGSKLELEVSEDLLLRRGAPVIAAIEAVRSMGVQVAIAGFGTGMASLSQVVNFPINRIKIDRSLVMENEAGVKERAIVRAIAALGSCLGLSTLVEGVGTRDHLAEIQKDGCQGVQGLFDSEAVPSAHLGSLVEGLLVLSQQNSRQGEAIA